VEFGRRHFRLTRQRDQSALRNEQSKCSLKVGTVGQFDAVTLLLSNKCLQ
jgi:hypothetical protein